MPESSNGPDPRPPGNSPATPAENRAGLGPLAQARAGLAEARSALDPSERFRLAHLAALARCRRAVCGPVPSSDAAAETEERLGSGGTVAPELSEWAAYFAGSAGTRAAVEAGAVSLCVGAGCG